MADHDRLLGLLPLTLEPPGDDQQFAPDRVTAILEQDNLAGRLLHGDGAGRKRESGLGAVAPAKNRKDNAGLRPPAPPCYPIADPW